MKHLFLPYSLALKAKEKGFNAPCFGSWHICNTEELKEIYDDQDQFLVIVSNWNSGCPRINAPIYQQLVDWLREEHNLHLNFAVNQFGYGFMYSIIDLKASECVKFLTGGTNHKFSYYEALSEAIEQALNLIE